MVLDGFLARRLMHWWVRRTVFWGQMFIVFSALLSLCWQHGAEFLFGLSFSLPQECGAGEISLVLCQGTLKQLFILPLRST